MAKRGRPPKPGPLRVLEGNRGKRPIPGDVDLPPSMPTRPEWMTGRAKKTWTRIVNALRAMRVINAIDRDELTFLCQAIDEAADVERRIIQLRKNDALDERDAEGYRVKPGLVIYSTKGFAMPNPLLGIRDKAVARFHLLGSRFGMSPADRASLLKGETEKPKVDQFEAFMQNNKKA